MLRPWALALDCVSSNPGSVTLLFVTLGLTSLCFSFLICNSEIIIISLSKDCLRIKYVNVLMLITCLKQLLGYNLCSINAFFVTIIIIMCRDIKWGRKCPREVKEKLLPPFLSFPFHGKSSLIGFLAILSLRQAISYLLFFARWLRTGILSSG